MTQTDAVSLIILQQSLQLLRQQNPQVRYKLAIQLDTVRIWTE